MLYFCSVLFCQDSILKAFKKDFPRIVSFEVKQDSLNRNRVNCGFGFAVFDSVESCKAAHDRCFLNKYKVMVSRTTNNAQYIPVRFTRGGRSNKYSYGNLLL